MEAVLLLAEAESCPPADHVEAVCHIDLEQFQQAERLRLPIHQRDIVDPEGIFHGRVAVQLLQHGIGIEAVFELDHQTQTVVAVREVHDVADACQLLGIDGILDLLDDLFGAHHVGEFRDHQAGAAGGQLLHLHLGACLEGSTTGGIGIPDPVQSHDAAARGQVRTGDEAHDLIQGGVGVGDQVPGGRNDFHQVVRSHVRRHANGNAGSAVDQQVGESCRKDFGLRELVVVVRDEVHHVFIEVVGHGQRSSRQACLGVTRSRRAVVERAEVAVAIDQRQAERKVLRHADHGVVDGRVAVGVELSHDLAHNTGALDVTPVRAQAHVGHHVQNSPLDRLQAVARVRKGARIDHRVGILQEGAFHLGRDVNIDDVLGEIAERFGFACGRLAAGHGVGGSLRVVLRMF
ncbi:hypothetical protein PJL18_03483 [Paenarthrobacter nicotinovorans]|nr:hypothetical protein [Paenarthrobacter nicotinovorans]